MEISDFRIENDEKKNLIFSFNKDCRKRLSGIQTAVVVLELEMHSRGNAEAHTDKEDKKTSF